jgi:hypothetical protein
VSKPTARAKRKSAVRLVPKHLSASGVGFGSTAEILRLLERVSFTPASRPIRQLDRSSLLCQLPTSDEPTLITAVEPPRNPRAWVPHSGLRSCSQISARTVESECGAVAVGRTYLWRCLTGSTLAPFPHPAHRTGLADFPHPALGQDFTPAFACNAVCSF